MRSLVALLLAGSLVLPTLASAALPTQNPANYTVNQTTAQTLSISWDPVPLATTYVTTVVGPNSRSLLVRSMTTSIVLRGLSSNVNYTISTNARNAEGSGPQTSSSFSLTPASVTAPPTNLSAVNVGTSAVIRWNSVSNAVRYTASLQDLTTGLPVTTLTPSLTIAAFTGLSIGHQYSATIDAFDSTGGHLSSSITFVAAALSAPSAPLTGLTVTPQSGTSALATWNAIPSASAYQLFLGTNPSTLSTQRPLFVSSVSRTLTGLTSGTTYYLAIRPLNQAGFGAMSSTLSFLSMTPPVAPSVSVTPGILAATATWPSVSGATSYSLYLNAGSFNKPTASVYAPATSPMILNGLTGGQTYNLAVSASNPAGEGALSTVQGVTPNPLLPPANLVTGGGSAAIETAWDPASGATSYEIGYNSGATFASGSATIVPAATNPFTISSLTNGQVYSLAMRSVMGTARSAWSSAVQETPQPLISVLYRDARVLAGAQSSDCSYQSWYTWVYMPCTTGFNSAVALQGNAYHGATGASTIPLRLNAGSYHVWFLGSAQSPRTIRVQHNAASLTATINTAVAWVHMGTLTMNPSSPFVLDMQANGTSDNVGVYLTGFYLTQGNETPTYQPAGNGGDLAQPLAMPTGLTLTPGPGAMTASWTAVPGATSYNLYYLVGTGTFSQGVATTVSGLTGTSTTLTGLPSNTTIQVAVSAVLPNGESVMTTVQSAVTTALIPPTNVVATPGSTTATIGWTPASGVTTYDVGYQAGTTFNENSATIVRVTANSTSLTGLTNGQAYVTAVRSVVGNGVSAWTTPAVSFSPMVIYTRFYRDIRSFGGIFDQSGSCPAQWWNTPKFVYSTGNTNGCKNSSTASSIYGNANQTLLSPLTELPAISTTFNNLSGTYKIYAYVMSHTGTPVTVRHNSQTITKAMPPAGDTNWGNNTGYSWQNIGTLTMTPGVVLTLTMPAGNNVNGNDNVLRGFYLTAGTDTPSCVPSGINGDQADQSCPQ